MKLSDELRWNLRILATAVLVAAVLLVATAMAYWIGTLARGLGR